jgi:hypothetical protein
MSHSVDRRRARLVHWFALAVLAACLAITEASLAKPPEPAAERVRLFQWFGTLGFPDVRQARFVRYPTSVFEPEGEPIKVLTAHGFKLGENKDAWTLLTFSLKQEHVQKRPQTPAKRPADWACQEEDLAAFAKTTLTSQAKPDAADNTEFEGSGYSKTTRLFFLAWACWQKGLERPAAKLFEMVTDLRDRQLGLPPGGATLRRRIAVDLAHEEFLEAQRDLSRDDFPREKVLARLESIPQRFPGLESAFWAQEMARVLRTMVQEDREHAKKRKPEKPCTEQSRKELIANLIFELRDQPGNTPGTPREREDIFLDTRNGESPAQRLFKLGYEAVPPLIEALSDERFSRTLEFRSARRNEDEPWLNFRYHVLTVGDCALQILERLACREFCKRSDRFMSESSPLIAAAKRAVTQWNDELQRELKRKGERQVLVDTLQSADWASTFLAEPLLAKYPDAALPALATAARKATDWHVMLDFVRYMDRAVDKRLIPTLLDELKSSPSLDERITVATLLLKHQRSDGAGPLAEEWKRSAGRSLASDTLVELAYYLAKCGKADAVTALAQDLGKRPANIRLAVVRSFAGYDGLEMGQSSVNCSVFFHDGEGGETALPVNKSDKFLFAEVVRLLMGELQDTESTGNESGRWGDASFSDPRIADVAAQVLHQLEAKRFPFDLSAPPADRDRQRVLLINAWRKTRNLPEMPVPRPRTIPPSAEETLRPLLDRLQMAKADAREVAERDVEKLGPGAVAGILKRSDQLKPADPRRKDLAQLARRAAHTVVEIQFADRSLKPSGKVAARLEALKNKPLNTLALVELTSALVNEVSFPVHGCRLHLFKAGPSSGVVLRLDLLDKARNNALHDGNHFPLIPLRPNGFVSWQYSLNAQSNGQSAFGESGSDPEFSREDLQRLGDAAFGTDLRKPLEIKIEYVGIWIE